jgi:hypothetical protein
VAALPAQVQSNRHQERCGHRGEFGNSGQPPALGTDLRCLLQCQADYAECLSDWWHEMMAANLFSSLPVLTVCFLVLNTLSGGIASVGLAEGVR